MRTTFVTPEQFAKEALRLARETHAVGAKRPLHFQKVMKENRGILDALTPFGSIGDGLERKNPLIAALGDSVTAGHFEACENQDVFFKKASRGLLTPEDAVEITDARECYLEKFRLHLIERYEQTSVSTINSGIAGDTVYGMQRRLYRDVIRYQPDLVLVNGSLNWGTECGDTKEYRRVLTEIVRAVKSEVKGDLVLLTPNMELPSRGTNPYSSLLERVEAIRSLAGEEDVCLADVYRVWERYQEEGYPIEALLSGPGHPSVTGHEMYALVLMQLMA